MSGYDRRSTVAALTFISRPAKFSACRKFDADVRAKAKEAARQVDSFSVDGIRRQEAGTAGCVLYGRSSQPAGEHE
jgi:hypothetical protein